MGAAPLKEISTSKGRFLIRPYQPGDEGAILASWARAFGKDMPLEEWRWKYPANPYGFRCLLCLAEDGTVVVHYAAQVVHIAFEGKFIRGLHLTDSFSHPSYRWALGGKQGLFVRTGWLFLNTYLEEVPLPNSEKLLVPEPSAQFHYGFPGERHFRLGLKFLAYRQHNPGVLYGQKEGGSFSRRKFTFLKCGVEEVSRFNRWEQLNRLFFETLKYRPFCVVRDALYLRWRFSRPGHKYLIFYVKNFLGKKIKAWIILSLNDKARLLDFWAEEEAPLVHLLEEVAWTLKRPLEVWLAGNHPLKGAFLRAGFNWAPEPLGIIPNTRCDFAGGKPPPETADRFFFTMADADLF